MPRVHRLVIVAWVAVVSVQCSQPQRPLRVGVMVWPPYEIPLLARSLGRLDPAHVEIVDYASPVEALRAYRNGVVEGVALPTTYAVELLAHSRSDRVVLVIDVSNGGDAVIGQGSIKDVRDLKGRRVGIESGTLGRWVLTRALQAGGLTAADLTLVSVDVSSHEASFRSGAVDAVVTYEPMRSRLVAAGGRDIFNSSQMPGEIVDVLLVTRTSLEQRRAALQHLAAAWFDAVDYLRRHPDDAARRVAQREGLSPDAYLVALAGTQVLGRSENEQWLSGRMPRLDAHIRELAEAMARAGLLTAAPSMDHQISSAQFIQ